MEITGFILPTFLLVFVLSASLSSVLWVEGFMPSTSHRPPFQQWEHSNTGRSSGNVVETRGGLETMNGFEASSCDGSDTIPGIKFPRLIVFDLDNTLWTPE